jgi:hypothetical protein
MAIYKNVSQGGGVGMETNVIPWSGTGYNAVSGSNLTFTMAQLDPNNGRPFSNLFSSFKLPMISGLSAATWNLFAGTNFSNLATPNVCVISIASNQYGELIDGRTIKLVIPTGQTSPTGPGVPATIELYSSYVTSENWSSDNSSAAARFGNPQSNSAVDVGAASTNVAFMFSDQLYPPQSSDHSTWSNGYPTVWGGAGSTTPTDAPANYGVSVSNAAYYNILQTSSGTTGVLPKTPALSNLSDTPVGIAYLDKGFIVITDSTLVDSLLVSGMTSYVFSGDSGNYGDTASTPTHHGFIGERNDLTLGAFTASTSARCEFYSFEKERLISVVCVAGENEFYSTSNATAAPYNVGGAGGAATQVSGVYDLEGGANGGQDYSAFITELGLYDANNNLLAVAKPDRPIEKPKNSEQTFTLKFKF